jgi:DNA-binding CsgD family transcriptional regulator
MYSEAASYRVRIATGGAATDRSRPGAPLEVLIVSSSPILGRAFQELLTDHGGHTRRPSPLPEADVDPASPTNPDRPLAPDFASEPDLVLLVPQGWQELAQWLPGLFHQFACPWLLIAEARLVGMFLSRLEARVGAFLPPQTAIPVLWRTLQRLGEGHALSLRDALRERFARGAVLHVRRWTGQFPTLAELQCGCAVSLGLGNREIAEALFISEATVKCYVHQLLEKFELTNRRELSALFYQALALPLAGQEPSAGEPHH